MGLFGKFLKPRDFSFIFLQIGWQISASIREFYLSPFEAYFSCKFEAAFIIVLDHRIKTRNGVALIQLNLLKSDIF